jgi:hypothetical protein
VHAGLIDLQMSVFREHDDQQSQAQLSREKH